MQSGVFITAAAGNEANARHHMTATVTDDEKNKIEIRVGENEESFLLSIWTFPQDRMSVSVTSPLGETVSRLPAEHGLIKETKLKLENTIVTVEYYFPLSTTGSEAIVIKLKKPTPGIWSVHVYGDSILNGEFHAWLPITDFVDPETTFLTPNPYYTVTCPATSFGVTTCGSYSSANQSLYVSSSWGPSRFSRQLPDLSAPGVNVSGIYPWGYGTMSGTSVPAAITAGAGALILQWGLAHNMSLNSIFVRTYLLNGANRRPGFSYPNYQWGNVYSKWGKKRPLLHTATGSFVAI
jgi:subtilisin family serine protease